MNKEESILKMEELDLNTLDYFITANEQEVMHYLAKHNDDLMSLRTQRGQEYLCPFYYMMLGKDLLPIALNHLHEGYTLILAPSLDTKGCLAFGAILFSDTVGDTIEYVIGEGKVRELDNHPNRYSHYVGVGDVVAVKASNNPHLSQDQVLMLNRVYKTIKDAIYDDIPCVVEWSYYDRGVGRLNRNLICWEIRGA